MINEIEFFSTNQKDVFKSLCDRLILAYNLQGGQQLNVNDIDKGKHVFYTLIRKIENIIFYKGDPLSVKPFLSRILKGEKHHGKPANITEEQEFKYVGKGHFEWDHKAQILDENGLKAIKVVLSKTTDFSSKTEFKYKGITVVSELYKSGVEFPNSNNEMLHNHFRIKAINGNSKISFDYYDSHHNYCKGHTELSENDIIQAFDCFINDSLSADMDFQYFCGEFGYDTDIRKAYKIYKACCKSLEKANKIIKGDLYDFANEFREAHENII